MRKIMCWYNPPIKAGNTYYSKKEEEEKEDKE
jgi:hypothetical protein